MKNLHKSVGLPALHAILLVLPFATMEIVNRRELNEKFPFMLFFFLWLNLFAISLILLPIVRAGLIKDRAGVSPAPSQLRTLLFSPRSATIISLALILAVILLSVLTTLGWEPLDRLINGTNPEQPYIPGMFISLAFISAPIIAGIIAGGPVINTLRAGGRLFAHPVNLLIVVVISLFFASRVVGMIVDQWPCFMGVPLCD